MTQVGQLFPPLQYIPSSPIPPVVIAVELVAFGRMFSYGIEVAYDPAQNAFLLVRETLVESSAGSIVYRLDRNATNFTETRYGRTSVPFAALFGTFLLATSNGLPADHPICLVRNELANQFLLSPLPEAMTGLVGQPTVLSPDCANFAAWLFFFLGRQSDYYAAYVGTLSRMGLGQVVLNAQTGTGGACTLMVKFGYHAVPLVFSALSRCEKLLCLAAAVSTFNRMIPGTVCVWDDFLDLPMSNGKSSIIREMTGALQGAGQFIALGNWDDLVQCAGVPLAISRGTIP